MRISLQVYISLVALGLGAARYFNDYHIINGQSQGHDGYDDVTKADSNDVENRCRDDPQYGHPYMCQKNDKDFNSFNDVNQGSRDYSKELENVEEYSIVYQINNRKDEQDKDSFQENGYQRVLDWIYTLGKINNKVNNDNGNKNGNQYMMIKNNGGRGYSQHWKQDKLGNGFRQHGFVKNSWQSSKSGNENRGSNGRMEYGNVSPSMKIYNIDVLDNRKNNDGVYGDNKSNGKQNGGVNNDAKQTDGIHTDDVYIDNQYKVVYIDGVYNTDSQTDESHIDGIFNDHNQTDGVYNGNNQTNGQHTNGDDDNQTDGLYTNNDEDNRTDGPHTNGDDNNRTDRLHTNGDNHNRTDRLHTNGDDDNRTDGPHTNGDDDNQTDGPHTIGDDDNRTDGPHMSNDDDNLTYGQQTNGDDGNQTDGIDVDCLNDDANQTDCFKNDVPYNAENQTDEQQSDDNTKQSEQNKEGYQTNEGTRLFMNRANEH